jgi:Zn-dependent protease
MSLPDPAAAVPLEFDLGDSAANRAASPAPTLAHLAAAVGQPARPLPPRPPSRLEQLKARGGILGTLASLALLGAKFIGAIKVVLLVLLKMKFLLTAGTMLLSIWYDSRIFGWPLAVGIVGMIFLHECGHAIAARSLGLPYGGMLFVPGMGAVVFHKRGALNVAQDAFVGIAGPIAGTLVGMIFFGIFKVTGERLFLTLAAWTFAINLFNLLPTPPLDGGWIVPVFSPKLLAIGMVLLVFVAIKIPLVLILAAMSLPRVIAGWKAKPETSPYFSVRPRDRWIYGLAYIALIAALGLGTTYAFGVLHSLHQSLII